MLGVLGGSIVFNDRIWQRKRRRVSTMTENDIFEELMASVQEMDDIIKGQALPTRQFEFPESEGDE